ncbi:MAG: response regulator, partial [Burkholderiales bacterium]|nr:response regulator [Burkholderiales bacterium]
GTNENALLYASARAATSSPQLADRRTVVLHGRPWTLSAAALPGLDAPPGSSRAWWVLAGGLVISLLVFAVVYLLATDHDRASGLPDIVTERLRRANERLEGRVAARTRELDEANRRLRAEIAEREGAERERRRALAEERTARAAAEEAIRARDEFLAVLSHELRTPLNAIRGWAHILGQEAVAPHSVRRGAAVIERNVAAQERLIDVLLDSALLAAGRIRLEARRVRLAHVVAEVVESLQPAAEEKGVGLRVDVSIAAGAAEVTGDPRRLTQVAWNLVSNALKFTPSGGAVDVRLDRADDSVRLSVSDTGEGIAPEFLPHVFAPFRQADSSSRRRAGGLGLGLALVKELVELHGGRTEAMSAGAGRGATLVVTLPAATTAGANAADQAKGLPPVDGAAHTRGRLAGCAVLVIDDHADTRDAMRALLELEGARVRTARSVGEAFECLGAIRNEPPAVILCDIELPEEDGYAFLERLRERETHAGVPPEQRIPVLAVTAYAGERDRTRALAAGFAAHVTKPIDPGRLVAAVRAAWPRA